MTKHRVETPDTLDDVIHLISHMQSQGWGTDRVEYSVEYDTTGKHAKRIPVGIFINVALVPPR